MFNYGKVLGHLSQPQLSRQLVCLRLMEQILQLQKLPSLRLSATTFGNIDMGSAGGELQISAIQSQGGITINAGNTSTLNFDVGARPYLQVEQLLLHSVRSQTAADATRVSSIATDSTFTLVCRFIQRKV